ncbi:putative xylitol dehydrogenase [Tilletiaria anomala UBC 951]|uniref:L-arabinitol 4-dehydrogenase n=1 Tax=Tilletiaria anomala (strain ATCC 24038 / CBS 436.72 / UBC 951) TaxID=1037660 RepID=A0A066W073_TILAU|nr:putative xylitol dehydrogenase [Tilletiaria anomala UBC 951]KDN47151.1 putative xylitol dehydrogenase [Tilletiaria anomala UBC 951]
MAPVATDSAVPSLKENLTLMATHDCQLKLVKSDAPKPGPGQALVHVRATGVCGSDVHFWKHGCLGPWTITDQTALGHESGGIVIAVGAGVTNVKPGDRVAIEPGVPCGKATCKYCLTGQYNLCPTVDFYSVPPANGTLTRYHVHPAGWLHKVPDSLSYAEIACLEPLSVCLHATQRADIRLGHPVLITGAGPIGVVQLLCAKAAGASPIVITDLQQDRLDFARKLVADVETYKVDVNKTPRDAAREIVALFTKAAGGVEELMPSIAMECTGVESSISTCAFSVAPGGRIMVIGVGKPKISIDFMHISTNEQTLLFLFRYRDTWPKAIRLVASGVINVKQIVTSTFPLEKAKEAVEHAADRTKFSVKTIIVDDE